MIDRLKKILRALNKNGLTLLIIEHNMPVIMDLCEWVIVLHHGEKIAEGTPVEIQNNREVLEVYLEG
jgi:ABC-type branched-subunit amino acid transport system ATPase component